MPRPLFTRDDLFGHVFFDPRWPTIGPHESREAWLMTLGWKPAAYFFDGMAFQTGEAEQALIALAKTGVVALHQRLIPGLAPLRCCVPMREAIYVRPGRADAAAYLQDMADHWRHRRPDIGYRREMAFATALGYGADDIRHFIWRAYG